MTKAKLPGPRAQIHLNLHDSELEALQLEAEKEFTTCTDIIRKALKLYFYAKTNPDAIGIIIL